VQGGEHLLQSALYIIENKIKIYARNEAPDVIAGWHETLSGEQYITVDNKSNVWGRILGIAEEAFHLQQDPLQRATVEGELEAWKFKYSCMGELNNKYGTNFVLSDSDKLIANLTNSRDDLDRAVPLMKGNSDYPIGKAPPTVADLRAPIFASALAVANTFLDRGIQLW
jgi:hypothetical protein